MSAPAAPRAARHGHVTAALLLLLVATPALAGAPLSSLGRLFFTPAERAALETARTRPETATEPAAGPVAETPPPQLQLAGVVRRSAGRSLAWLNGVSFEEGSELHGYRIAIGNNAVLLQPPAGPAIRLGVGQIFDTGSGRIVDPVPPGSLAHGGAR